MKLQAGKVDGSQPLSDIHTHTAVASVGTPSGGWGDGRGREEAVRPGTTTGTWRTDLHRPSRGADGGDHAPVAFVLL